MFYVNCHAIRFHPCLTPEPCAFRKVFVSLNTSRWTYSPSLIYVASNNPTQLRWGTVLLIAHLLVIWFVWILNTETGYEKICGKLLTGLHSNSGLWNDVHLYMSDLDSFYMSVFPLDSLTSTFLLTFTFKFWNFLCNPTPLYLAILCLQSGWVPERSFIFETIMKTLII